MELDRPVFIGGTGRSGTSIMAKLLHSHPEFCLPGHENKLIVERAGLKDLVQQLGGRYDLVRNHTAIHEFVNRALRVRRFGFRDIELNVKVGQLGALQNLTFPEAFEIVQRENPQARGSIHAVGQYFGLAHYDACCTDFVNRLRINKACQLLMETDRYITNVCYDVGFNNVANFNRRFLQIKGMTPKEFRRQAEARFGAGA